MAAGWLRRQLVRNALHAALIGALLACMLPTAAFARSHAADVAYERGAHAYRLGETDEALRHLERAGQLAPDDPEILRLHALVRIAAGQARAALGLLMREQELSGESTQGGFLHALASWRAGDLRGAEARFARVLADDPGNARAHLLHGAVLQELGRRDDAERALHEARRLDPELAPAASYRLGQIALRDRPGDARKLFQSVTTGSASPALTRSAQRYLEDIPDRGARRVRAAFGAGVEFDSNANVVGDDALLQSKRARDMRGVVHGGIGTRLLETERLRVDAGLAAFMSNHADERDYDTQAGRATLFGSAALIPKVHLDVLYFYESAWQDFERYHGRHYVKPALRLRESRDHETRLYASFENRSEYYTALDPRLDHDGGVRMLGAEHTVSLSQVPGRPLLTLGYAARREDTDGREWDSRSDVFSLELRSDLPAGFDVEARVEAEHRDYDHPSLLEPFFGKRSDRIKRGLVAIGHELSDGLRVEATWRITDWGSNVQGMQYERQVFGLSASYAFE